MSTKIYNVKAFILLIPFIVKTVKISVKESSNFIVKEKVCVHNLEFIICYNWYHTQKNSLSISLFLSICQYYFRFLQCNGIPKLHFTIKSIKLNVPCFHYCLLFYALLLWPICFECFYFRKIKEKLQANIFVINPFLNTKIYFKALL